jgi:hypothetical protein
MNEARKLLGGGGGGSASAAGGGGSAGGSAPQAITPPEIQSRRLNVDLQTGDMKVTVVEKDITRMQDKVGKINQQAVVIE